MADQSTRETIEAVWRIEASGLMAGLERITGDVGLAEDLAQEAFIAAFEHWGHAGGPAKPGAWLTTTARNRALDRADVPFEVPAGGELTAPRPAANATPPC